MEEREVVRLLQHYRHDLMNKLQLVQGYLNMGKTDKTDETLKQLFLHLNEERKLIGLDAPKFILWLIQFDTIYKNFRVSYDIHIGNKSLDSVDDLMLKKCKMVMDYCMNLCAADELYEVHLVMKENREGADIEISFYIHGPFNKGHNFNDKEENKMESIHIAKSDDELICRFLVPWNE